MLPWNVIQSDQKSRDVTTITLLIPYEETGEIVLSPDFTALITQNIYERRINYSWISPSQTIASALEDSLFKKVFAKTLDVYLDSTTVDEELIASKNEVARAMKVRSTPFTETSLRLWSRVPGLSLLYNISASEDFYQYGIYWNRGLTPYASRDLCERLGDPFIVEGWTYMHPDDYKTIQEFLIKIEKEKI